MSDVIDRLTDARDRDAVSDAQEEIIALRAEKGRLTARVKELEEGLRYYADEHQNPNGGPWGIQSTDFGSRARALLTPAPEKPQFTTGHCIHKKAPGGCQLHNLQCGYPDCDRRAPEKEGE